MTLTFLWLHTASSTHCAMWQTVLANVMGWRMNSMPLEQFTSFNVVCIWVVDVQKRTKSGDFHQMTFVVIVTWSIINLTLTVYSWDLTWLRLKTKDTKGLDFFIKYLHFSWYWEITFSFSNMIEWLLQCARTPLVWLKTLTCPIILISIFLYCCIRLNTFIQDILYINSMSFKCKKVQ